MERYAVDDGEVTLPLAEWGPVAVSHEVIKRVGRRAYRYRVDRYRDPQTQKMRARWTYLGITAPAAQNAPGPSEESRPVRRATGDTRKRLLDAFERLAERESYAGITADAISLEAGVAHGTFYRYFRDKRALFTSVIERLVEDLARTAPLFEPPYGSRDDERQRLRRWLAALFARKADHPGVLRAYYEALEDDPELRQARETRRRERVERFARYLDALAAAGTIDALPAVPAATALLALVEATLRSGVAARGPIDATAIAGVITVLDRAVFQAGCIYPLNATA
jgi:AcrR family transcriptional regulator